MVAGAAPVLVLVNPQDIVNIASAVRIARNFGIERMRLVNPAAFDPWRIEGIAHNSAEFVGRIEILDSLEAAVADCVHAAVLTARGRTAKRPPSCWSARRTAPSRWSWGGKTAASPTPSSTWATCW